MSEDRPLEGVEEAVGRLDAKLIDLESTLLARLNRKPVGDIELAFRGSAKEGTVFLQGQTLNRADYVALWAWAQASGSVVAGGYGVGNGTTTFTLPDWRGRVLIGAGTLGADTYALGATGGAATRTLVTANMPAHDHNVSVATHSNHDHTGGTTNNGDHGEHMGQRISVAAGGGTLNLINTANSDGSHTHGLNIDSASAGSHSVTESTIGSGTAFDNRMPYLGINLAVWF